MIYKTITYYIILDYVLKFNENFCSFLLTTVLWYLKNYWPLKYLRNLANVSGFSVSSRVSL